MIKIGECWLDPKRISSMEWDRSFYMNGPGEAKLIITLENGIRHVVHHQPYLLGGLDAYEIERKIVAATQ